MVHQPNFLQGAEDLLQPDVDSQTASWAQQISDHLHVGGTDMAANSQGKSE